MKHGIANVDNTFFACDCKSQVTMLKILLIKNKNPFRHSLPLRSS